MSPLTNLAGMWCRNRTKNLNRISLVSQDKNSQEIEISNDFVIWGIEKAKLICTNPCSRFLRSELYIHDFCNCLMCLNNLRDLSSRDAAKFKVVNSTVATNRRVHMDLLGVPSTDLITQKFRCNNPNLAQQ